MMGQIITIRSARPDEAEAISRLVLHTMEQTNAKDYSFAVLEHMREEYSVPRVRDHILAWDVLVAQQHGKVVATGSLCGSTIRQMYVSPVCQGMGIGAALLKALEKRALVRGSTTLALHSSITAENFYAHSGFIRAGDDEYFGPARVIVMKKPLRRKAMRRKRRSSTKLPKPPRGPVPRGL